MNLERFLREREPAWNELTELVRKAHGRADRLGPEISLRLGSLYRAAAADLAFARRRWPGDPVTRRLETLVAQSRQLVYAAKPGRFAARHFFGRRYWRLVIERPLYLVVAAFLLFGPAALTAAWAVSDPGNASAFVPDAFTENARERGEGADLGLSGDEQAAFSSYIFTNNIRVTFLAFAGGIAAGLGTAFILVFNGISFGAISGVAIDAGVSRFFFELVLPHGILELSCIVVCAAAGLRMGWALVDPGHRPRSAALVDEGRVAIEMVLGTAPWLVLAGIVEGFITPKGLGFGGAILFGTALAAVFWVLVLTRGRGPATAGPAPSL